MGLFAIINLNHSTYESSVGDHVVRKSLREEIAYPESQFQMDFSKSGLFALRVSGKAFARAWLKSKLPWQKVS